MKVISRTLQTQLAWATYALLFCLLMAGSRDILLKGQRIKQFFAHSITQSLTEKGIFSWLSTTLPCPSGTSVVNRPWVEEPPIFHTVSACFAKLGFGSPGIVPLLAFLILSVAIYACMGRFSELPNKATRILWTTIAAFCPIFVRYSAQHIPDLLATALLAVAFYFFLTKSWTKFLPVAVLAVTTKALVIFPVVAWFAADLWVLRTDRQNRWRWLARYTAWVCCLVVPMIVWLVVISMRHLPNPFGIVGGALPTRHVGNANLLFTLSFWARFFTWNVSKGVGLPLFVFALWALKKTRGPFSEARDNRLLLVWLVAVVPYWLVVRGGNYIHDYYALPFALPWALAGVSGLRQTKQKVRIVFAALSVAVGLAQLQSLEKSATSSPENFCAREIQTR